MKKVVIYVLFGISLVANIHTVYADNGKLTINDGVINDTEKTTSDNQTSVGYQVAPDLFLGTKNEEEKQLQKTTQKQIQEAKQQSFQDKNVKNNLNVQPIIHSLFKKDTLEASSISNSSSYSVSTTMPKWLVWLIGVFVIIGAAGIGVVLGRKYSKIFRKGKKKNSERK